MNLVKSLREQYDIRRNLRNPVPIPTSVPDERDNQNEDGLRTASPSLSQDNSWEEFVSKEDYSNLKRN